MQQKFWREANKTMHSYCLVRCYTVALGELMPMVLFCVHQFRKAGKLQNEVYECFLDSVSVNS